MTNKERLSKFHVKVMPLPPELGGDFYATYPVMGDSISGEGATPAEAVQDLLDATEAYLEFMEELHPDFQLPEPEEETNWTSFTGRLTLRLPKSLHWRLVQMAEMEEVSLNSLITCILESAAASPSFRPSIPVKMDKSRRVAERQGTYKSKKNP